VKGSYGKDSEMQLAQHLGHLLPRRETLTYNEGSSGWG
jgi:hypothetical protein